MSLILTLATLIAVHMLAVVTPGASFLAVSRAALVHGRPMGLALALGSALGALAWAAAALFGLALVLAKSQALYAAMKLLGGLYLLYLCVGLVRHAGQPLAIATDTDGRPGPTGRRALALGVVNGFLTLISNPKAIVFFGSIFVTVLPAAPSPLLMALILLVIFLDELLWYVAVVLLLSAPGPRERYLKAKPWLDRTIATLFGVLGLKLVLDAVA